MNDVARKALERVNPEAIMADPQRGFRHFGEFAHAVIAVSRHGRRDPRLQIMATTPATSGDEAAGADGGFAVPPAFVEEIWTNLLAADSFAPLCDGQKTSTNSMVYPKDEQTPWPSPTNSVIAGWQAELSTLTQRKPLLTSSTMRLSKVVAFVPLTQELCDDAEALQTYLPKKSGDALSWQLNAAILQGTGAGQPLGIQQSKCAIVQAKDASQATQTLSITNLSNMLARLTPNSFGRALYLCNISALPALFSLGAAASGNPIQPAPFRFIPGTKLACIGQISGMPIVPTVHGGLFSTQGDLTLVDFAYYRLLTRATPIENAWSLDVYFDAAAGAFRAVLRVDGHPLLDGPLNPWQGATTLSPFIQLQAR